MFKFLLLLILLAPSCGKEDHNRYDCTIYGEKCRPEQEEEEPKEGVPGPVGPKGNPGSNGKGEDGQDGADGQNGQDAVLSTGKIGPNVPGKQYSACHHDYALLSNGWLLIRHQANGTLDQGAGTTGFNVWVVDIANFSLISEVGNVNYCNMNFNRNSMTLSGTVVDNTDGLAGQTFSISL